MSYVVKSLENLATDYTLQVTNVTVGYVTELRVTDYCPALSLRMCEIYSGHNLRTKSSR